MKWCEVSHPTISGFPTLKVLVEPSIYENGVLMTVTIRIELAVIVRLVRDTKLITHATIWNGGYILNARVSDIKKIRDTLRDIVDMFINDYLAANPKVQPQERKNEKP